MLVGSICTLLLANVSVIANIELAGLMKVGQHTLNAESRPLFMASPIETSRLLLAGKL